MGLGWLARNLPAITLWILIASGAAGAIIATLGGIAGSANLANTGGGILLVVAFVGISAGGGYAMAAHNSRAGSMQRIEESLADVQERLTRVETEQLETVADTLRNIEQTLGSESNVRQFRRNG